MKKNLILALATCALPLVSTIRAEEAGSGHYLPGATSSFIDALPGKEAFAYVNAFTYYSGSASGSKQLELGANIVANINGNVYADTSIFLYETPWKIGDFQYAVALAVPYVWMDVRGTVQLGSRLPPGTRRDTASGIGDIEFFPLMLGWKKGDVNAALTLGIYAPTGDFKAGALANIGKNYWTFEPGLSVSWLSSKIGTEVSLFTGFDFNTNNDATDYHSGSVFHADATVAQHLPLGKGIIGVGVNGFYYQQISADSGTGAKLGGFEGRTVGVGPVLSYATKIGGKTDMVAELKWLPEIGTQKRLQGDTIWFKLAFVF